MLSVIRKINYMLSSLVSDRLVEIILKNETHRNISIEDAKQISEKWKSYLISDLRKDDNIRAEDMDASQFDDIFAIFHGTKHPPQIPVIELLQLMVFVDEYLMDEAKLRTPLINHVMSNINIEVYIQFHMNRLDQRWLYEFLKDAMLLFSLENFVELYNLRPEYLDWDFIEINSRFIEHDGKKKVAKIFKECGLEVPIRISQPGLSWWGHCEMVSVAGVNACCECDGKLLICRNNSPSTVHMYGEGISEALITYEKPIQDIICHQGLVFILSNFKKREYSSLISWINTYEKGSWKLLSSHRAMKTYVMSSFAYKHGTVIAGYHRYHLSYFNIGPEGLVYTGGMGTWDGDGSDSTDDDWKFIDVALVSDSSKFELCLSNNRIDLTFSIGSNRSELDCSIQPAKPPPIPEKQTEILNFCLHDNKVYMHRWQRDGNHSDILVASVPARGSDYGKLDALKISMLIPFEHAQFPRRLVVSGMKLLAYGHWNGHTYIDAFDFCKNKWRSNPIIQSIEGDLSIIGKPVHMGKWLGLRYSDNVLRLFKRKTN